MREKDRLGLLKKQSTKAFPEEEGGKKKKRRPGRSLSPKGPFGKKLLQAGVSSPPRVYLLIVASFSIGLGILLSKIGGVLAVFASISSAIYLLTAYLDERAEKRKRKIVPQLAPFIDGLASALSTGFNLEGAIVQAARGVPPGLLREEVDRVANAIERGFSVRDSMNILRNRLTGQEIIALVVAVNMFASMGGTVLEPFRRLAKKIREQQQVMARADRDLVMVKQAFYLIFFLALGAPGVLTLIQPDYLKDAFTDSFGRIVLQSGAIMIIVAWIVFKKITALKI